MALKYEYSTANSYYVGLTFLLFFLIPLTYLYRRIQRKLNSDLYLHAPFPLCPESACVHNRALLPASYLKRYTTSSASSSTFRTWKRIRFTMLVGGLLLVYCIYQISISTTVVQLWDPYDTLGLPSSASRAQVQAKYHQLSLTDHPDKAPFHLKKEAEKKFLSISKAYRVLTNAKARKNFEKYGNPDGPQSVTFGMGLPQWALNTPFMVIAYLCLLIVLPLVLVLRWYQGSRYTSTKVLKSSLTRLTSLKPGTLTYTSILLGLSKCEEPLDIELSEASIQQLTQRLQSVLPTKINLTPKGLILYAHFMRLLPQPYPSFLTTCLHLVHELIQDQLTHLPQTPFQDVMAALDVHRSLTMAMLPTHPLLLQLPHFTLTTLQTQFQHYRTPKDVVLMDRTRLTSLLHEYPSTQVHEILQACHAFPGLTLDRVDYWGLPGRTHVVHPGSKRVLVEVMITFTTVAEKWVEDTFTTTTASTPTTVAEPEKPSPSPRKRNKRSSNTSRSLSTTLSSPSMTFDSSSSSLSSSSSSPSQLPPYVCAPYSPLPQLNGFYVLVTDPHSIYASQYVECRRCTRTTCVSMSFAVPFTTPTTVPLQVVVVSPYWFYQVDKHAPLKIQVMKKNEKNGTGGGGGGGSMVTEDLDWVN
ncbi:secretory subunit [Coelomomyces lativittatus]|nr:secretory subunit [Coelomomyces lativittatus]KAJ1504389.1 secretory subunit [Coelomomyces lativittatus]KAJ1516212.1 secretory subunit [Coelomomyces lativittatus]